MTGLRIVPSVATEWQPIETAPKDGTRLWLYFPSEHVDSQQSIGWYEIRGNGWKGFINNADSECDQPTHWMPLPQPPKAGA